MIKWRVRQWLALVWGSVLAVAFLALVLTWLAQGGRYAHPDRGAPVKPSLEQQCLDRYGSWHVDGNDTGSCVFR